MASTLFASSRDIDAFGCRYDALKDTRNIDPVVQKMAKTGEMKKPQSSEQIIAFQTCRQLWIRNCYPLYAWITSIFVAPPCHSAAPGFVVLSVLTGSTRNNILLGLTVTDFIVNILYEPPFFVQFKNAENTC